MELPWVSRELYNVKCEALKESEKERKRLLNIILGTPEAPLTQLIADALPDPNSKEAEGLLSTATGELSGAAIRRMAQEAANKRAGRG